MFFIVRLIIITFFLMGIPNAVELPDFTVLAEKEGNKVVNISSIVERSASQNNIPFQDCLLYTSDAADEP